MVVVCVPSERIHGYGWGHLCSIVGGIRVWLCCVCLCVLCVWLCVSVCVGRGEEGGDREYVQNANPCVHSKRPRVCRYTGTF